MNMKDLKQCQMLDHGRDPIGPKIAALQPAEISFVHLPEQFKFQTEYVAYAPNRSPRPPAHPQNHQIIQLFKILQSQKIFGSLAPIIKVSIVNVPKGLKPKIWKKMLCIITITDPCLEFPNKIITFHQLRLQLKIFLKHPDYQKLLEELMIFYCKSTGASS